MIALVIGRAGIAVADFSASTSATINVASGDFGEPTAPVVTCHWVSDTELDLAWDAQVGLTGIDILRSDDNNTFGLLGSVGGGSTSYPDTTVNPDPHLQGQYFYRVEAANAFGTADSRTVDSTTCAGYVDTIAGGLVGAGTDATAIAQWPTGVSVDGSNLYESDALQVVRTIDLNNGHESVLAGEGVKDSSGNGGPADLANIAAPGKVVTDTDGNHYFSEPLNNSVRMIDANGNISVIAGDGTACASPTDACGDGGAATSAQLHYPTGLALDASNNLFIADSEDNRIREVLHSNGHISTVAGSGTQCSGATDVCGDGGPATDATLSSPTGIAFDGTNFYVADRNDKRVRKFTVGGDMIAFAGNGQIASWGFDASDDPSAWRIDAPGGVYADATGGYITEPGAARVRRAANTTFQTLAGTGRVGFSGDNGPASAATLNDPTGIVGDGKGNTYVADTGNNRIRMITAAGMITTFAGGGSAACASPTDPCGDGGLATDAVLDAPRGVAIGPNGDVFIADTGHNRVRVVSPSGIIRDFAGTGTACAVATNACGDGAAATAADLNQPYAITWFSGTPGLLIADTGDHRIRTVATSGEGLTPGNISATAGTGAIGDGGDGGAALSATFDKPVGLAEGQGGWSVVDENNHRVRLDLGGTMVAFAGTGTAGNSGDEGLATDAELNDPSALSALDDGNGGTFIVIADAAENRLRFVDGNSIIHQVLGDPGGSPATYAGDGGAATDASLGAPDDVAWDSATSTLYIADEGANRVRTVHAGTIETLAGNSAAGFAGDGGDATNALLNSPTSVDVSDAGDRTVYVADSGNARLRAIDLGTGEITTIAGTGTTFADNASPLAAQFQGGLGMTRDDQGNLYVTDALNNRIRKIDTNGVVTTIAGNGATPTYGRDGGPAASAAIGDTNAIAEDDNGNVYIADATSPRVRKIDPGGSIATVAGNGHVGDSGDGGQALDASLVNPSALAVDNEGNLYIGDIGAHRVRKVDSNGTITTVAGDGTYGNSGDGGAATSAQLVGPNALAFDANDDLFIADGTVVREIDAKTGDIDSIAATSDVNGTISSMVYDATHSILYYGVATRHVVRKLDGGVVSDVLGTADAAGNSGDGGAGTSATIDAPDGLAYNPADGSLYVSDSNNNRVRVLDSGGTVNAFTGAANGSSGFAGDGGAYDGGAVRFSQPSALALLSFGSTDGSLARLLVVDHANARVRAIAVDANYVSTFAGDGTTATYGGDGGPIADGQFSLPISIYFHNGVGDFYVSELTSHRVRQFWDGSWTLATFAGDGTPCASPPPGCGDGGPATAAQLTSPAGMVMDGDGNLFIADLDANRVREVLAADGTITTVAGNGTAGTTGDGGAATSAEVNRPWGLAFRNGKLYIAESSGNVVRAVDMSNGHITTVAGNGTGSVTGDGGQAVDAGVPLPISLRFDANGNLFIGEAAAVRRVDAGTGVITSIAGEGALGTLGDKGAAVDAHVSALGAMTFDDNGNLLVADCAIDSDHDPCTVTRVREIDDP